MANPSAKGSNMKMIAAAIVVIIIIAVGVLVLAGSGGKKTAQQVTSVVTSSISSSSANQNPSASSVPTTTVQASSNISSASFGTLSGENLSVGQFARDVESIMYGSSPNQLNITYNYKTSIVSTGSYAFSYNSSGQINGETYFKNLRITTTSSGYGGSYTIVYIYNATSKTYSTCTSTNGVSYSCVSELNVSQSNVSSLGYFSSLNSTASGYVSNVQISSGSYNGQPCTQISADVHVINTVEGMPTTTQGTISMCFSQQNNVLLTQKILANLQSKSGSTTYTSALNYSDNEVSMSENSSPSITNLPLGSLTSG